MSTLTLVFLLAVVTPLAYSSFNDEQEWLNKLNELEQIIQKTETAPLNSAAAPRATGTTNFSISLECDPKPTSVHQLRPRDIDIVGAMGDSITAGFGIEATSLPGIAVEDRGLSWSIGGELDLERSITIPNILRRFNPQVKGYALGNNRAPRGDFWFNVAVGGARSRNMPAQARDIIDKMINDSRTNYENDWKLITIFIGGNDLCALNRDTDATPENYVKYLQEALDIMHKELPRTMVNVVEIMEIYVLPEVGHGFGSTPQCRAAQLTFCNYIVSANETEKEDIVLKNKEYQKLTQDLIASGRYDTREDFTVVLQPFFRHTVLPYTEDGQVDATFFAPDCFHFSSKGHAMGAVNLWNNMLEPVGMKSIVWNITDLFCPTEEFPYIFTNLNSVGTQWPGSTTVQPTTTTTTPPVTQPPVVCEETCSQFVPDWGIALLALAGGMIILQLFALFCLANKKKAPPKWNPDAKKEAHTNGIAL